MKIKLINKDIRHDYVPSLLTERGVSNIEGFLRPVESQLQSWNALDNVELGLQLMQIALTELTWKILLVVDSDADGYCSASILYNWLKQYNASLNITFIVHEAKQHGLEDIVNRTDLSKYDLVLLPDAGTNDDIYFAQYPDTKFLVLDHHDRTEPIEIIPTNAIVINNQTSNDYENKSLCGAGVTWQFCRALDNLYNVDYSTDMMDLAAVAIIADVMNITTMENRYIINTGLDNIVNKFLSALVDKQSYSLGNGPLTPIGIAFYIVPLINSMCRVGTLAEKERMFLAFVDGDKYVPCNKRGAKGTIERVCIESARECTNTKAKQTRTQEKMTELAKIQIININLLDNKILTIILDENFDGIPSEINGLTATKLANEYKHPTIVARVNRDGFLRGSARGLSTLDMPGLKEFFASSKLFEYTEGHSLAHGISIPYNRLSKLHDWANEQLKNVNLNEDVWEVDFIRSAADEDIADIISSLDDIKYTWGQGNPEPLIHIKDINISNSSIDIIGQNKDTVKITKNGVVYMFFKCSPEKIATLKKYDEAQIDVVGTMNVNVYYSSTTPQIFVKDFEVRDGGLCF